MNKLILRFLAITTFISLALWANPNNPGTGSGECQEWETPTFTFPQDNFITVSVPLNTDLNTVSESLTLTGTAKCKAHPDCTKPVTTQLTGYFQWTGGGAKDIDTSVAGSYSDILMIFDSEDGSTSKNIKVTVEITGTTKTEVAFSTYNAGVFNIAYWDSSTGGAYPPIIDELPYPVNFESYGIVFKINTDGTTTDTGTTVSGFFDSFTINGVSNNGNGSFKVDLTYRSTGASSAYGEYEMEGEATVIMAPAGEEKPEEKDPREEIHYTNFAPNNKYRRVNIYGQPQTTVRPQQDSETDRKDPGFSIDSFDLTANYSVTDVSIPLQGTDLKLEFRRNSGYDKNPITHDYRKPLTRYQGAAYYKTPDVYRNTMGSAWKTNTAAHVAISFEKEDPLLKPRDESSQVFTPIIMYYTVTDVDGGTHRYRRNGTSFVADKKNFNSQSSDAHKLNLSTDGELSWRKKNGTTYTFEAMSFFHYRVESISDRNDNRLDYTYLGSNPYRVSQITYAQEPKLNLKFTYNTFGSVNSVTDPMGRRTRYVYNSSNQVKTVYYPGSDGAKEEYQYIRRIEYLSDGRVLAYPKKIVAYHHALSQVVDAQSNTYRLSYTGQYYPYVNRNGEFKRRYKLSLASAETPVGKSEFKYLDDPFAAGSRKVEISDIQKNSWTYLFDVESTTKTLMTGDQSYTLLLNQFSRTLTPQGSNEELTMTARFTSEGTAVNLTDLVDYHGTTIHYDYGEEAQYGDVVKESIDPGGLGITKKFSYDSHCRQMNSITDGNNQTTSYLMDAQCNRIQENAPGEKKLKFEYNDFGYKTKSTDADGRVTLYSRQYLSTGWLDTTTITGYNNELNIVSTAEFDLVGNLLKSTDANGNVTRHEYDQRNNRIKTTLPVVKSLTGALISPIITRTYDNRDQVTFEIDAKGNRTSYKYDELGRRIETRLEMNPATPSDDIVSSVTYDAAGNKTSVTDPRGTHTTFTYDAFNNLIKEVKDAGGHNYTTSYEYGKNSGNDLFGDSGFVPTRKVDPRGIVEVYSYDKAYRLIKTHKGRVPYTAAELPNRSDGELKAILLSISTLTYDKVGNVITNTLHNSEAAKDQQLTAGSGDQQTKTIYDTLYRPIKTVLDMNGNGADEHDDADLVTTKSYDLSGNVLVQYDAEKHPVQFEYDGAGRKVKTIVNLDDDIVHLSAEDILTTVVYDKNSNVLSSTLHNDTAGAVGDQTASTTYDALNRAVTSTGPEGQVTETSYDLNGNVIKVKNARGFTTTNSYDQANRLVKTTMPQVFDAEASQQVQPTVSVEYDLNSNKVATVDARGLRTETSYDKLNRAIETRQIVSTGNIVTQMSYDGNNNLITTTFKRGDRDLVTTNTYDAFNRLYQVTDPEEKTETILCDLVGNKIKTIDKRSFEASGKNDLHTAYATEMTYDLANRLVSTKLPEIPIYDPLTKMNTLQRPTSTNTYLKNGWLTAVSDFNGNSATTTYDNAGRKVSVVDAENNQTDFSYDKAGNVLTQTVHNDASSGGNQVTQFSYDKRNLQVSEILNPGSPVTNPQTLAAITVDEEAWHTEYTQRVSSLQETNQTSIAELSAYTEGLNTYTESLSVAETELAKYLVSGESYEDHTSDRKIELITDQITDYNGEDTGLDLLKEERERLINAYNYARKIKNSNSLLRSYEGKIAELEVILESYLTNLSLLNTEDQQKKLTFAARKVILSPFTRTYTSTYDENGNKKTRSFPNEAVTTYSYDALDRLIQEAYSGDAQQNRTFAYNNNGVLVKATDQTGVTQYNYDLLGRQLTEKKSAVNGTLLTTVTSLYDKANNRISCTFPSGKTLVSTYDGRNLLKTLTENGQITEYSYDENGNRLTCTVPNGQVTTNTYDKGNRVTSMANFAAGKNVYTVNYDRDATTNQLRAIETRELPGAVTAETRSLEYTYDKIYRLTSESDDLKGTKKRTDYSFDKAGNRLSKRIHSIDANGVATELSADNYTVDALNRVTLVQGTDRNLAFTYDINGNRLTRTLDINSVLTLQNHHYDQENRLIRVDNGTADIFTSTYDYRTRRMTKTESGITTFYTYDAGVCCEEWETTNDPNALESERLTKIYIRGNGMGGGIGSVLYLENHLPDSLSPSALPETDANNKAIKREFYTYNAVGTVVANTDISGNIIKANDFDAFGIQLRSLDFDTVSFDGSYNSQNDLLFSTKERDASTGLDCFGFRYYDSEIGRFTTRDPSGYPDGANNQLYVENNPINFVDPLGLMMVAQQSAYGNTAAKDMMSNAQAVANAGGGKGMSAANKASLQDFAYDAAYKSLGALQAAGGLATTSLGYMSGQPALMAYGFDNFQAGGHAVLFNGDGQTVTNKALVKLGEVTGAGPKQAQFQANLFEMTLGGLADVRAGERIMRETAKTIPINAMPDPLVVAKIKLDGKTLSDTNQRARAILGDPNKATLIGEEVAKKIRKQSKPLPNGTASTAHAEIGVMQQAADSGLSAGVSLVLDVSGQPVCGHCIGDVVKMAKKMKLKNVKVNELETGKVLEWDSSTKSKSLKVKDE